MKKKQHHIIRLIILSIIGLILLGMAYSFRFQMDIIKFFAYLGLIVIWIIYWIWAIIRDYKSSHIETNFKKSFSILIGIFLIFSVVAIHIKNEQIFNKPSILKASFGGEYGRFMLDLKEDNTYIYRKTSMLKSEFIHGTHQIKDNTILLDKEKIDEMLRTRKLLIKRKRVNKEGTIEDCLIQIDEEGVQLPNYLELHIYEDNR